MLFVDKCIVRADNEITDNSINGGTLMKKILAWLSVMALCLSLVGGAFAPAHHAHAEEACAHENLSMEFINEDGMFDKYHALTCLDCWTVVGEPEEHQRGAYGWYGNNTHSEYCSVCFVSLGEAEPCVPGTEYVANFGEGTHSLSCSLCGGPVSGEAIPCTPSGSYVAYAEEDGYHYAVCSVCENEFNKTACTPSGEYVMVWEGDACIGHQNVCAVCDCGYGEVLTHKQSWFRENGMLCAYGCTDCGYAQETVEHDWDSASYKDKGDGTWHSMTCKRCGGEGAETHWIATGTATYASTGDAYTHTYSGPCEKCGVVIEREGYHYANSCGATACAGCGQEGALVFRDMIEHEVGEWLFEDGKHYQICAKCNQKVNVGPCEYYCDEDGCYYCGKKNPGMAIHWDEEYVSKEDGHYWVCVHCGNEEFINEHAISCDEESGSFCWYCGEEYPDLKPAHDYVLLSDENGHWEECWLCGDKKAAESHVANCLTYGVCYICTEELPEDAQYDHFEIVWMNTGKQHWSMCSWCGEIIQKAEDHTPAADDATKCSECGGKIAADAPTTAPTAEPTVAPTTAPTAAPTEAPEDGHEHGWKTREIPATCEQDGFLVDNCPICGIEMGRVRVKATGHQYGEFVDNGDGTRTAACAVCGATVTETVEEPTEEPTEEPAEEPAEEAAEEPAEAPVPVVEGENVPVNAVLEVKAAEEVPVDEEILSAIEGTVEKAFTATLFVEGEKAQPAGEVTVKLPVTEEEIAQLEGKVIMVIAEDGTVTEVAFEIVENELIIKTEILGTFIIVAKAA